MVVTTQALLRDWVTRQAGPERGWFESQLARLEAGASEQTLHLFLGLVPRRLGKADLQLSAEDLALAERCHPGWHPTNWSLDGAARIAGLLAFRGKRPFAAVFKDLVRTADARELIALYRGLALYPQPESLAFEVGEGLRSNMRAVFEAIAHGNPYPRDHFDIHRWNHMVLKALFIGSRLAPIVGLDARSNPELARILIDYAQERWAAGRAVTPELWRCVGPHADSAAAYAALERALGGSPAERLAATLALTSAGTDQARHLLAATPEMVSRVDAGQLGWDNLSSYEAA
ncbi:EboA domain-containing protein [Salinicola peritrichatus]|uniref:EboA domain-containing protein n=1 Tax=Salinicola peritrichatus TaxID=1267424 RepID=UPI0013A65890|nr:EboA domain-containing protein [Salinicola peritrichatus]